MSDEISQEPAWAQDWKALRESKGFTLEEISEITHITIPKLKALEKKAFDELGEATFAAGYVRSYAKFLKEDPDSFVQVYKDATQPEEEAHGLHVTQTVTAVAHRYEYVWKKINIMHLSIGVIGLWIVLMLVFGGGDEGAPAESSVSPVDIETEKLVGEASDAGQDLMPTDEPERPDTTMDGLSQEPVLASESEALPAPEIDRYDASLSEDSSETLSAPEAPAPITTTSQSEVIGDSAEEDILIFSFSDDCWIEVSDGIGRVLIAQLKRKGDNLRIFGQGPFKVKMGNARAVSLTANGRAISTTPPGNRRTLTLQVSGE